MAQTPALFNALKKCLRTAGYTYADVGKQLELSEATVKRMFAQRNISLHRLDGICELLGMEFADLVRTMDEAESTLSELTEQQETEIVNSTELLLILVCLVNYWTVDEIRAHYDLDEHACINHLAKLDRLKIIDLLPMNRVRLRLAHNFKWRDNGPIQRFFLATVEQEFFKSRFTADTEKLICINGTLSDTSNATLQTRMQRLASDFTELCKDERQLPLSQRFGTTMVVAIRRWEYSKFDDVRKR